MCKKTATVALILVIIGALNWGFIGISDVNAVEAVVGTDNGLADIIYIVVGLAGLYAFMLFKPLGLCSASSCCFGKKEKTSCCSLSDTDEAVKEEGCCRSHTVEKEANGECCKQKKD